MLRLRVEAKPAKDLLNVFANQVLILSSLLGY